MRINRHVLLGMGLIIALLPLVLIYQHHSIFFRGKVMLLELDANDPRSLMQGDYLHLHYRLARQLGGRPAKNSGTIVVQLDAHGVAKFKSLYEKPEQLAENDWLLRYRKKRGRYYFGSDAFFMQEGWAERFWGTQYAELRVSRDGKSVLAGLRDGAFKRQQ